MEDIRYPEEYREQTQERICIAAFRDRRLQYRIDINQLTNARLLRLLQDIRGKVVNDES